MNAVRELAEVARDADPSWREAARGRSVELAELARDRAELARERAAELADTAGTEAKKQKRRWT